ncbi:MAG: ABC transporter ATP-binding protein [Balneola sp.]
MDKYRIEIQSLNLIIKEQAILNDITFEFKSGLSYLLLGRNGAGKSSLLNCILNLVKNFKGNINYEGFERSFPKCSLLPELLEVPDGIIAREYLDSFVELLKREKRFDIESYEKIKNQFEIQEFEKKSFKELSKGMKKQLYICLILAAQSELVVLDEPFEGLDLVSKEFLIDQLLNKIDNGTIVIASSHELAMIYDKFDYILCLKKGGISNIVSKSSLTSYEELLNSV